MATTAVSSKPAWQAELGWESRHIRIEEVAVGEADEDPAGEPVVTLLKVRDRMVYVSRPGHDPIRFRVNYRKGRSLTVTDPRDRLGGTAGTTGIWGTRPAPRVSKPRSLTLSGFQLELVRFVGAERAEEIVRSIRSEFFLDSPTTTAEG